VTYVRTLVKTAKLFEIFGSSPKNCFIRLSFGSKRNRFFHFFFCPESFWLFGPLLILFCLSLSSCHQHLHSSG
jgi:hypothetical protein